MELNHEHSNVLGFFTRAKIEQDRFIISCIDDHVFIKLPHKERHFWSPQLHLEITKKTDNQCSLHGFFGPNPTVWTLFMFLHVAVGILFMVNAIWMYTQHSLNNTTTLQIGIAIGLVLAWVLLYFAGAAGKKKGKSGMRDLYDFMLETIP
ncbi:GTP-binding protein [Aequorivita marina]|uniref:GTP-binding protein n=1 Tax=Aequorivita marina TaxID=3073654 RepID=UPI0028767DD0|nr:GTP-binding protein [Aequorivita sp. S2608]MDS1297215.1 GTP-binding protein [Aequorivita sp. S2608]